LLDRAGAAEYEIAVSKELRATPVWFKRLKTNDRRFSLNLTLGAVYMRR
jgi:hypothetical protein